MFVLENNLNGSEKQDLEDLLLQDNIIITSDSIITIGVKIKKTAFDFLNTKL
jgi:hypothetical protein